MLRLAAALHYCEKAIPYAIPNGALRQHHLRLGDLPDGIQGFVPRS
jgi:hypothetical protein